MVAAALSSPSPNPKSSPSPSPRPPLTPSESNDSTSRRRPSPTPSTASSSRRFPSPLLRSDPKRAISVDRTRPDLPEISTVKSLTTTTRSLSVSFQGESFFYRTSKAKASNPSPARRYTPERRRPAASTPLRPADADLQLENAHRWPRSAGKDPNVFASVRLLPHSIVFEEGRRVSFDAAADLSASSDSDSVSSGSNSGMQRDSGFVARSRGLPRGISVPARFLQETSRQHRKSLDQVAVYSSPSARAGVGTSLSPRMAASPLRGPIRPASPSRVAASPGRAMASPSRMRNGGGASLGASPVGVPGLAPSIISFAAEVRRAKKGENRIEEAHLLRLLHNRHLQWRFINARTDAAMMVHRLTAEKKLYNAWVTMSEMRDSVTTKRIKLQLLTQNLKLTSILKGQMAYLEEWYRLDMEHCNSLSGSIEALKASTLRLPVVGGARAEVQDVMEAVGSVVDVMQAMASSICSLLTKAEGMSSLVSEFAKVAAQEQALLDQANNILSTVAALHVKQCSLRTHILQLKRESKMLL